MNNQMELKTSAEWAEHQNIIVLDPDGWDRKNFKYSFGEELITLEEFNKRLMHSTIMINKSFKKET